MKLSMDNVPYLIIGCCFGLVALMLKYTRGDMVRGLRRIRTWFPF